MATKIIHKKSSVAEKVPLTTDLEVGELAINLVDKKLFSKDGNGNIIEFGSVEVQQLTVYNGTGATIPKGSAVYINGAQGQRPSIALASNASEATSSKTIGFVNADILNGAEGVVTTEGLVYNLNTAAFTEGGAIYLGATAGSITQTKPVAPAHLVSLGWVVKAHASSGRILAHVQNGFELNELHDVLISSPTNTQVLAYETSTGLWKNSNLDWANVQNKPDPVITLAGDLSGSVTLTDLASGTLTATIAANSVTLGTDTTGNYVATIAAGTSGAQTSSSGLTISATAGEGTAATIAHADTSTAANLTASGRTYVTGLTFDTYGHVTAYTTGAETVTDTNTTSLPIENSAGTVQFTATDTTGLQFVGSGATTVAFDAANSRVTISSTDTTSTYTLPAATSTALGGVELFSDTVQTVAAEAVSATASRTYGVQVNAAGQAVVNVPWVDTNSGGNALTSNTLAQFAATTSAQLAGVISDETGSGKLTFATSPTFTTSVATDSATLSVFDTTATTVHAFGAATTGNLGYDGTAASTTNLSVGANTSGVVKTVNIGTGGASGSTTNITLGSVTAGANSSVIVPGNMSLGQNISAVTGPILTLGTLVGGGSGFMNGTHTNQVFTGGTGSYMLGTVTVALGVVTGVTLTWGGHRYTTGDVLTVPSLSTTLATTAASGTGTTATITFAAQAAAPFEVGSQIIVAGVTPTGYNGTFTVTACTTTSVSYATITTGAQTVAGTVKMGTPLTASTIPVATVQGTDLYVSSYTSDAIGSRIRLETNDTSTVAGQEYGAITFSGRDASANGSGDLALIRGVGVGTSGGSDLQFWTAANGGAPKTAAVITSAGNFRLYNSAGTFYSELSNSPTTNRTITIPDGTGTLVFDTSPSFTTGINAASTTMALFDTTATTVNAFGATTTLNLGYDGTAQSTTNLSTGAVASGIPKTVNIGTGGSGASTTNINIGANDNGGLTINSSAVNAPNANLTAYTLAADYIDANAGVMQIHAPAGFGAQLNFYPDASTYGWSINAETDNTISFYSQTPNEAVFRVGAAGQIGVGVVTDYGTAGQVLTSGGTAGEASWTTLPTATSTVKGVVELFSDTVQTVAANAVTATASRTYGVQVNSAGQAVVNVPWTDSTTDATKLPLAGGTLTGGLVGTTGQFTSFGVGTAASGTTGEIRATNNITAYYSDDRLKTKLGVIDNALEKVLSLSGFYYEANSVAQALGYEVKQEVGVSAQEVQAVMPEVVAPAPIDERYLTVRYERLVPLLIEAIKEQQQQINRLKAKLGE